MRSILRSKVYNQAVRILVAGGSGFVGRSVCRALQEAGHEPLVLSRRPGPSVVLWDGASKDDAWLSAAATCPAWINLCGEGIAERRWSQERREVLWTSRLLTTSLLVDAMRKVSVRPKVFISASAVGYYGDMGNITVDESDAAGQGFLAGLCADWEREALRAAESGVRVVCLRLGAVLGREGGMLARLVPLFKLGLGGPLGDGKQWLSWILREDLVRLIIHLLAADVSGAVNAVAPEPVTNGEFSRALGAVLHRPAFLRVPGFALRLALGGMASMLLTGQRVVSRKVMESGFVFKHPSLDAALRAELL